MNKVKRFACTVKHAILLCWIKRSAPFLKVIYGVNKLVLVDMSLAYFLSCVLAEKVDAYSGMKLVR